MYRWKKEGHLVPVESTPGCYRYSLDAINLFAISGYRGARTTASVSSKSGRITPNPVPKKGPIMASEMSN
jgi:hypothetical protein